MVDENYAPLPLLFFFSSSNPESPSPSFVFWEKRLKVPLLFFPFPRAVKSYKLMISSPSLFLLFIGNKH